MLKGTEPVYTTKRAPEYKRKEYVLSPSSEYYIHGRGSERDYKNEVGLVKAQLREMAFGDTYDLPEEEEEKRPINASGIALLVLMAISLAMTLLGKAVNLGGWLYVAEGIDGITAIQGLIGEIESGSLGFGPNVAIAINMVVIIIGIAGCIIGIRKESGGAGTVTMSIIWIASVATVMAAAAMKGLIAEKGLIIEGLFAIIALIIAAAERGKRKKRQAEEKDPRQGQR